MAKRKPTKQNAWLKHFLNEGCSTTFLNATESAKRAGYLASSDESFRSIGYQNFTKLADKINTWLDEHGLSESALKIKLVSLLNARETKFFAHEGRVVDEREVEAIEVQRRTLDLAFKLKGSYAPEKHDHSGEVALPVKIDFSDLTQEERDAIRAILSRRAASAG
ncbi:MAG: hypothetical protein C4575_09585 [Desulforudis sp.]|nr:MAG: hypothetical protein C4575_09585 [Desulforudis sp.]